MERTGVTLQILFFSLEFNSFTTSLIISVHPPFYVFFIFTIKIVKIQNSGTEFSHNQNNNTSPEICYQSILKIALVPLLIGIFHE